MTHEKPNKPITLGPLLLCILDITFLSTKVVIAIQSNKKIKFNNNKKTFLIYQVKIKHKVKKLLIKLKK